MPHEYCPKHKILLSKAKTGSKYCKICAQGFAKRRTEIIKKKK